MSFPRIDENLRTNADFRNKIDASHHKTDIITTQEIQNGELKLIKKREFIKSPLEDLPFDLIKDFVVADSLHLIDLGIVKRCLVGWIQGSFNFKTKFFGQQITAISEWLQRVNSTMPNEIHRAARGLDCISFWKGSEFRTFLLYLGPIVLKNYLSYDVYKHFLLFACAITICSSRTHINNNLLPLANQLLRDYIEDYIDIYGIDSINSNVHNLCHLINDVERFGALSNFSTYPFENKLGHIKKLLRSGNKPLSQVANRIGELDNIIKHSYAKKLYPFVKNEISAFNDLQNCCKKFRSVHLLEGMVLTSDRKNQWFLTKDNKIVQMAYATIIDNKIHVYGSSLKIHNNFFEVPFPSNHLYIFAARLSDNFIAPQLYNLINIKCKLFCLPENDQFVFFPLLHTLDLLNNFKY